MPGFLSLRAAGLWFVGGGWFTGFCHFLCQNGALYEVEALWFAVATPRLARVYGER